MVEMPDARGLDETEHGSGATHVGLPGLGGPVGTAKGEARGIVDHAGAVFTHPVEFGITQPATWLPEFADEYRGHWEADTERLLPCPHDRGHPLLCIRAACGADDHCQRHFRQQQIPQDV